MKIAISFAATVTLCFMHQAGSAPSKSGQKPPAKVTACDSDGFLKAAQKAERSRVTKRINEATFDRMATEPKTIVLDARSSEHWKHLRIKNSVNCLTLISPICLAVVSSKCWDNNCGSKLQIRRMRMGMGGLVARRRRGRNLPFNPPKALRPLILEDLTMLMAMAGLTSTRGSLRVCG